MTEYKHYIQMVSSRGRPELYLYKYLDFLMVKIELHGED